MVVRPGGAQGFGAGSGPPFAGIMVQPNENGEFSWHHSYLHHPLSLSGRVGVGAGVFGCGKGRPWTGTTGDGDCQDGDDDGDKYGVGQVSGWVLPRARTAVGGDGRGRG